MTHYKTRPGVVLTYICGEYFLVAAKSLLSICPYVTQINESSAFFWKELLNGATQADLEIAAAREYEIDDPVTAQAGIAAFLQQMQALNYLVSNEEEGMVNEE